MDNPTVTYTLKRNEILTGATTWMNLEDIMLSEGSQGQKDKCRLSPLIWGLFYKSKRKRIWRQGTTTPLFLKLFYLSSSQPDTCLLVCSVRPQVPSVLFPIFRRVWLPILGSTFPSGDGRMGNFMSSKFKRFIIGKQFLIQALKSCLIIDKYKI